MSRLYMVTKRKEKAPFLVIGIVFQTFLEELSNRMGQ